ncbi:hypothetical protein CSQ96_26425 [Janthinobacterium sp. BJB412]|nr:hypothetical protein CSQ96_26425 [Janthinobacterium sp. BJB412]
MLSALLSGTPPALLSAVLAALFLLAAGGAGAQTSGSVTLSSDYRWRGESLSDGRAASQLAVNYDNAAGWYGGAQLASVRLRERDGAQAITYAGLARRQASGWSWEAGASATVHSRDHASDYREGFVGLAGERLGVRLSLAPRYLGRDLRSAYLELKSYATSAYSAPAPAYAGDAAPDALVLSLSYSF